MTAYVRLGYEFRALFVWRISVGVPARCVQAVIDVPDSYGCLFLGRLALLAIWCLVRPFLAVLAVFAGLYLACWLVCCLLALFWAPSFFGLCVD